MQTYYEMEQSDSLQMKGEISQNHISFICSPSMWDDTVWKKDNGYVWAYSFEGITIPISELVHSYIKLKHIWSISYPRYS